VTTFHSLEYNLAVPTDWYCRPGEPCTGSIWKSTSWPAIMTTHSRGHANIVHICNQTKNGFTRFAWILSTLDCFVHSIKFGPSILTISYGPMYGASSFFDLPLRTLSSLTKTFSPISNLGTFTYCN